MINVEQIVKNGKRPTKKEKKKLKQLQEIVNQSERDFKERRLIEELMKQESFVIKGNILFLQDREICIPHQRYIFFIESD